jgi:hypothetical protein
LPSTALNHTCTFQLPDGICDSRPVDSQHFAEEVLSNQQFVVITAVTHHEQPTGQPLFEAVRSVARYRHQDLLEKGLD